MLGLPTETDEDIKGIPGFEKIAGVLIHTERSRIGRFQSLQVQMFCTKYTPFQWARWKQETNT